MSEHVVVVVPIKAAPGKGADVVAMFTPCIDGTVQEEGCLKYALLRDKSDPDTFTHVEVWRSQADLDAHFEQPYLQALLGSMGQPGLLAAAPSIGFFTAVGVGGDKGEL